MSMQLRSFAGNSMTGREVRRSRQTSSLLWMAALVAAAAFLMPVAAETQATAAYSQDELDQLLAPIALYPDQLLTQVLIASTYPLEVVEAARFVQENAQLTGEALDNALAERNWDPSVQSLAAFPQVLAMMNDKLEWTQRLGDAFLADEQRVMDTVQSLRRRAEAAGNLGPSPQQTVVDQGGEIVIQPAQPDVVYVPVYDPLVVYGPWWAPAYPPWFWYPPYWYGYPAVFVGGIVFGTGWHVWNDHWGWSHADWHGHHVTLDVQNSRFWTRPGRSPPPAGAEWRHSPFHRRGVAYPDAQTRERFVPADSNVVRERQSYRGYPPPTARPYEPSGGRNVTPSTPQVAPSYGQSRPPSSAVQPAAPATNVQPYVRPPQPGSLSRSAPSAFDPGLSREQAQVNAQRGIQSLQSTTPTQRSAPAPIQRSAPMPAQRSAPAPSGGTSGVHRGH